MSHKPTHTLLALSTVCFTLLNLWGCDPTTEETPADSPTPTPVPNNSAVDCIYYPDVDGDGYGDNTLSLTDCSAPEGYVAAGNDCDDADAQVYPGAPDVEGDGRDQSCDGIDGLAPSVGLSTSRFTSIQQALNAAQNGQTVWVGPGNYTEYRLTFEGKAVKLISTRGETLTVIDGQSQGTVFIFRDGEDTDTVLEGFTLTGGRADFFTLSSGYSNDLGGGVYVDDSSPTLTHVTLIDNSASDGGGMFLYASNPVLTNVTITDNSAFEDGGGMHLVDSAPVLTHVTLTGNAAYLSGGGMYLNDSSPVLTHMTLSDNRAEDYGGGIFLQRSSPVLTHVTLSDNTAGSYGGGMSLLYSDPVLTNVTLTGNFASTDSGGMYLESSNPVFTHMTLTANQSRSGGGMYLRDSSPIIRNSILAYNTGLNLAASASTSQPVLSYTNLFNPFGASHNLPALPPTVTELDPRFVAFSDDGNADNDDLHLRPSSPLMGAGDPSGCNLSDNSTCDPDGSLPDLGAYGGAGADFTYYTDSDGDTLYDGWELAQVENLITLDSQTDTDGDGLGELDELNAGTNGTAVDTDGDGFSDGEEVSAGRDPLNPFSVPGVEGLVTLDVPSSMYPTVQSALDAIPTGGYGAVTLAPGTYEENMKLTQKRVILKGAGEALTVLDGTQTRSVIRVENATLELSGVTVRNGKSPEGGGMHLAYGAGSLTNVTLTGNEANNSGGGGIYLLYSTPVLTNVTLTGNTAPGEFGYGGGMHLLYSTPALTHVTLTGNEANNSGGGMFLDYSNPVLTHVTLTGNEAYYGGGIYLSVSDPALTHLTLSDNEAYSGGGMLVYYSTPTLTHVTLTGNEATDSGGGMYLYQSSPVFNHVTLSDNEADFGGGMNLYQSSPVLTHMTLSDNEADFGGGMYLSTSSSPIIRNSILAYNTGMNLQASSDSLPVLSYTNLFNLYGASHNLPALPPTVTELDPGFVAFSDDGNADNDDLHLRPSSRLIDAGDPSGCDRSDTSGCDPDGSLPDLGAYGGAGADFTYYSDSDGDTLYDGWELAQVGNLTTLDSQTDTDGDGLGALDELNAGTHNTAGDTDGDGFSDGEEVSAGRDPLSPFSVPGVEGLVTLDVPSSTYPTVQSALNAIPTGGYGAVTLAPGTYRENLTLTQKRVVLEGAGEALTILDGMQTGSVMRVDNATLELSGVTVRNGKSTQGGGMYLEYGAGSLTNVTLSDNEAYDGGGGMYLHYSGPMLTNVTLTGNTALGGFGYGGGMALLGSDPVLTHATLSDNKAGYGGGMFLSVSSPTLRNSLLAYNTGLNLLTWTSTSQPVFSYTNLFNLYGASHNLPALPPTVTELDPRFVAFSDDGNADNDDLHLRPSSPLIDAGDPSGCDLSDNSDCDPDGSLPDLGAYGGAGADFTYYTDSDGDTLYDGWELAQVKNLITLDSQTDTDGDGLGALDELDAGTHNTAVDTDGDGFSDGEEVSAGRDPLNPFSVPGVEGLVRLEVPSSLYPTVQSALDAIPTGGYGAVKLAPGTYRENLKLTQKRVVLEGAGEALTILDGMQIRSVIRADNVTLELSGVTVRNGKSPEGGGMYLACGAGSLTNVTLSDNEATQDGGGGIYLLYSDPVLTHVTLTGNTARGDLGYGGGMLWIDSDPVLTHASLSDNKAKYGGGMFLDASDPVLTQLTLTDNEATSGGGMFLDSSDPVLTHVTLTENEVTHYGGGMYLYDSDPVLTHVTLSDNEAYDGGGGISMYYAYPVLSNVTLTGNKTVYYGGGMYLSHSSPVLTQVTLSDNEANDGGGMSMSYASPVLSNVTLTGNRAVSYGGGMYVDASAPVLTHVTLTGNTASAGGGMCLAYDSHAALRNSVVAYNSAKTGGNLSLPLYRSDSSTLTASDSLLYTPRGYAPDTLTPTGTYLVVEPKFLDYADTATGKSCDPGSSLTCLPSDLHLSLTSPLINAGSSTLSDPDGSRSDIGSYGGPDGDGWDVDRDGVYDYFWPGEWADAPSGFGPAEFDCDDLDADVWGCG